MDRQKLEHALAQEVIARQDATNQLKELQDFVIATSQLSQQAMQAALVQKAQEVAAAQKLARKRSMEEVEIHANEEWAEEMGLGPNELKMLSSCEIRGDHLFVEPLGPISPRTKLAQQAVQGKKELIIGHS